jgi:DNA-binding transcriptional LysR family regulator
VREADEGVRRAREVAEGRRGRLIVGAPPLLSAALMPSVIRVFEQSAPEVKVELVDRPTSAILNMVLSGDLGLGVGTFPKVDPGLCKVPLISDQISLLCRFDQPIASNERPTWRDLVGQPLLALRPGSGVREQVNRGFHLAGLEPTFNFEFDQLSTLLAFVEAGLGVTVLPIYALSFLPMGSLIARPLRAPEMTRKIDIVYRLDRSLTPAAHEFVRLLRVSASTLRRTPSCGGQELR